MSKPLAPNGEHITYQYQYRKCGKPTCNTCRNSQGHGPYWYAYWKTKGKIYSGYIGKTLPSNVTPTNGSIQPAKQSKMMSLSDAPRLASNAGDDAVPMRAHFFLASSSNTTLGENV